MPLTSKLYIAYIFQQLFGELFQYQHGEKPCEQSADDSACKQDRRVCQNIFCTVNKHRAGHLSADVEHRAAYRRKRQIPFVRALGFTVLRQELPAAQHGYPRGSASRKSVYRAHWGADYQRRQQTPKYNNAKHIPSTPIAAYVQQKHRYDVSQTHAHTGDGSYRGEQGLQRGKRCRKADEDRRK